MTGISVNGTNGTQDRKDRAPAEGIAALSLSSQAIHADDFLNDNTDVAPPLHVSTTFRYPGNADSLIPWRERNVRSSQHDNQVWLADIRAARRSP